MSHIKCERPQCPDLLFLYSDPHIGMGNGKAANVVAVTGVSGYIGRY